MQLGDSCAEKKQAVQTAGNHASKISKLADVIKTKMRLHTQHKQTLTFKCAEIANAFRPKLYHLTVKI